MNTPEGPRLPDLGDDYRIVDVIGEGGMGTVYRAEDLRHDRSVAVKTIRRDYVTPDVTRRFEREIKLTSSLQHPRILPLLDSGVAEGALFYVMQYIEGETLEERLAREGQLQVDDAVRIARHVADALDYAHARGVVHRDIKPANIMLSGGHTFVMDFGIARALAESATSLTDTGSAMGTPKYMSPEQIDDAAGVDGRSDIYSLGCVLYEMVAGQPPFAAPTVDSILRQHLAADPTPLAVHRPGTPPALAAIVNRAMQKSPADRYSSAADLEDALVGLSAGPVPEITTMARVRRGVLVIGAYVVGGWGVVELIERVAVNAGLPDWTVPFAIVLLLIGLLVVGVTTAIQVLGFRPAAAGGGASDPDITPRSGTTRPAGGGFRSVFRWRNVIAGGVLAMALWGVVAAVVLWRDRNASAGETEGSIEAAAPGEGGDAAFAAGDPAPPPADTSDLSRLPGAGEDSGRDPERDPAAEAGPVGAPDSGSGGSRRDAAEPSTARSAAADDAAAAREVARRAREDAAAAGASAADPPGLATADSLWLVGVRAAAADRWDEATDAFERTTVAYEEAAREAREILTARVDSAWRGVDSLRSRARPNNAPYGEGEAHRTAGREAERAGDFVAALEALDRAARAYSRALPFVELPPSADAGEAEEESDPEPPDPRERVSAAMSALERVFEAEDLAGVQRIWTNLDPEAASRFREFFQAGEDLDYRWELDPSSIRAAGEGLEFRVRVRWQYRETRSGRLVSQPAFEQDFRLEEAGARDVLISL